MKKQEKIIILIIVIIAVIAGIAGYFIFRNPDNDSDIDYEKYEQYNLDREKVDLTFDRIRQMEEEMKIKENHPPLMMQAAGLKKMLREYEWALADYEKIIEIEPEFGPAYAEAAEIYVYPFGEYEKAADYYQKAVQFASYRTDYYRWLADLYISKFPEKKSEIEQLMLDGFAANEGYPDRQMDFYSYLAAYFQQEGDLNKAIEYTKKCIQIAPDDKKADFENTLQKLQAELKNK